VRGSEFIERVLELGRERQVSAYFDPKRGKGSHGTLYYAGRKTTVKDRRKEIGAGLLARMIRQLGLASNDFR
jgi:predicted RNA binding protein YcfA (HicA-like mRNA interferase family)